MRVTVNVTELAMREFVATADLGLQAHFLNDVRVFEDHFVLKFQRRAQTGVFGSVKHCLGNGDVEKRESHGVEIDPLGVRFPARFVMRHDFV